MEFKEYQQLSKKTAIYDRDKYRVLYPALGLCGEAGEVAEKVKKVIRGDVEVSDEWTEELKKELGDVLWYLSQIASDMGISLDEVAQKNITKLAKRMESDVIHGSGDNR